MKKYKVLVPFYKLSDRKSYRINDEIELIEDDAEPILKENKIELIEEKKAKK